MKKILLYIQITLIKGIFFIIPILICVYLFEKIWKPIQSLIQKASIGLHIDHFIGRTVLTVLTISGFLFICFLGGLMMQLSKVGKLKFWIEENILRFTPGYVFIKQIVGEKLKYDADNSKKLPAFVLLDDNWIVGVVTEYSKESDIAVVFLPGSPKFNEGSICIVKIEQIKLLPFQLDKFKIAVEQYGKGFATIDVNTLKSL